MFRALSPECRSFKWLLSGEEMKHVDQEVIERYGIPGPVLMETAGRQVALAINDVAPVGLVVFVCGAGNNGGDGFVAARHMYGWQRDVLVLMACDQSLVIGDARIHFDACMAVGVPIKSPGDWTTEDVVDLERGSVIVDGLLGTGLRGNVRDDAKLVIEAMNDSQAAVFAIDIPSGVCSRTGRICGAAVRAQWTLTFQSCFFGHWHHPGADLRGELMLADIGMPLAPLVNYQSRSVMLPNDIAALFQMRDPNSHKGTHGHCLVVGGRVGASGAVLMAADAVLAAGAGLATVATVPELVTSLSRDAYEVMIVSIDGRLDGEKALLQCLAHDTVVIGPGLPHSDAAHSLIHSCVSHPDLKGVLDADGLNQLGDAIDQIQPGNWVLTPHPGEAARLLGGSSHEVQENRYDAVKRLARESGSVVVLKGAHSLVAEPDGRLVVCSSGNPGMATAGTGDVLAGVIGSLLAQGLTTWDAARFGVLWHAMAGDAAREQRGVMSLRARDVINRLGEVERCYRG